MQPNEGKRPEMEVGKAQERDRTIRAYNECRQREPGLSRPAMIDEKEQKKEDAFGLACF
jgi:hypothetical protein